MKMIRFYPPNGESFFSRRRVAAAAAASQLTQPPRRMLCYDEVMSKICTSLLAFFIQCVRLLIECLFLYRVGLFLAYGVEAG